METPVIYFSSPKALIASVHVDLPSGVISEWYPKAVATAGAIAWKRVEVTPGGSPVLPTTVEPSHYYAARETDAVPLRAGGEDEKLLFYRGIADFDVPVAPRFLPDGKLELRNLGAEAIRFALVFENRGGRVGFRVVRDWSAKFLLDSPELTADAAAVHEEMAAALREAGLFPKEAAAMIATWRDSWFEEGMRVFYLVPRNRVDAVLPIRIDPAPGALERVFVGRVEVLSPAMRQAIQTALAGGDTATLTKYGRFLRPFCDQILHEPGRVPVAPAAAAFLARADQASPPNPAPCRSDMPAPMTDQR
jgi:hypothetical protein